MACVWLGRGWPILSKLGVLGVEILTPRADDQIFPPDCRKYGELRQELLDRDVAAESGVIAGSPSPFVS